MLRLGNKLANHGLHDPDIPIQQPAQRPSDERNPDVRREPDHDETEHGAEAPQEQHRLPADAVREGAPVHARQRLGQRERRDEEARVERGILLAADLEALDEGPGVGEDGGERYGLGQADDGCTRNRQYMLLLDPNSGAVAGGTHPEGRAGRWESHQDCARISVLLGSSSLLSAVILL